MSAVFKEETALIVTHDGTIASAVLEGAAKRGYEAWAKREVLRHLNDKEITEVGAWQRMFTKLSNGATNIHFVNTMGTGIEPKENFFEDINMISIRSALEALQTLKIRKNIAHISSIAATYYPLSEKSLSHFQWLGMVFSLNKRRIERLLITPEIPTTILRTGFVFNDVQKDGTIVSGYDYSPEQFTNWYLHPLVGSGKQSHQPVYMGDLVEGIFNGLESNQTQVVNAVGPETMTQAETIKFFVDLANRPFKPIHMHGEMAAVIAKHFPKGMLTSHAVAILRYLDESPLKPFSKEPFEELVGKPLTSMRQVYPQR
jgi:nucleoside-diphosphate-sugar epimerase